MYVYLHNTKTKHNNDNDKNRMSIIVIIIYLSLTILDKHGSNKNQPTDRYTDTNPVHTSIASQVVCILGDHDRQTNRPTDRPYQQTDMRIHREVTLTINNIEQLGKHSIFTIL